MLLYNNIRMDKDARIKELEEENKKLKEHLKRYTDFFWVSYNCHKIKAYMSI